MNRLPRQLRDLATVLEALDARTVRLATTTKDVTEGLAAALDDTRRSVGQLQAQTGLLTDSTVWQRLRWIVVGR